MKVFGKDLKEAQSQIIKREYFREILNKQININ
jgi:hypothetical protein